MGFHLAAARCPNAPHNSRLAFGSLLCLLLVACGGSQKEPEAAPAAEDSAPAGDGSEDLSADEAELLAQIEESAAAADAEAGAATSANDSDEKEREIVYRVSQEGMKVIIGGATFIPTAEAVKVNGRWGVKLSLEATTEKDKVLFSGKKGPLAFGGFVERGSKSQFGDQRGDGQELALKPGEPMTFSRTWPDSDQQGLAAGEKLELHVGLWGLGNDATSRRPVNRFFVVKMVADKVGAQPLIQPPGQ